MEITTIIILLLISIIAGAYGAIVGAGGGFILVPALLLIFSIEPKIASGTGLLIVLINSLSALYSYLKLRRINFKLGIFISIGAIPGIFVGIQLLENYSNAHFHTIFSIILILMGIFLMLKNTNFRRKRIEVQETTPIPPTILKPSNNNIYEVKLVSLGILLGVFSGYLGIGGGWLLVPILVYGLKIPVHIATATSIFSLAIYTFGGVILQVLNHNIDYGIGVIGAIGVIIGSQAGVFISRKVSGKIILQLLSVILVVVGIQMFLEK